MHILEIHVKDKLVHEEYITSENSALDIFNEHVRQSVAGEVISLYKDNSTIPSTRTLIVREDSPYTHL